MHGMCDRVPVPHPHLFQAAPLCLGSVAVICLCGWQWQGKSHPLSVCPVIHPADERLHAWQTVLGGLLLPARDC